MRRQEGLWRQFDALRGHTAVGKVSERRGKTDPELLTLELVKKAVLSGKRGKMIYTLQGQELQVILLTV